MNPDLRAKVRDRAGDRCEYCRLPQQLAPWATFHVEHIVARQHGGGDELRNLAWSCDRCNLNKGPNLAGRDPRTGTITRLYNPRRSEWSRHFRWDGPVLVGRTAVGRTTVEVLRINHPQRVLLRGMLIAEGTFPPAGGSSMPGRPTIWAEQAVAIPRP